MTLLIVDGQEIIIEGLKAILAEQEEIDTIKVATQLDEAMNKMVIYQPDVIVMEMIMDKESSFALIKQARNKGLTTKFVIFTSSQRHGDFEQARALSVDGYILKNSETEDIVYGIKSVGKGHVFYDSKMMIHKPPTEKSKQFQSLTERELQVFEQVAKGLTNNEIAQTLYIAESTVKKHITSIMGKLELKSRTEIALYAMEQWRKEDECVCK